MGAFLNLLPLAMARLRARWVMMLPLLAGSVLAVALVSSTVIYGDAIRQLGLEHSLREAAEGDLDVDLLAYNAPPDAASYLKVRRQVDDAINRNVWWFADDRLRGVRGSTLFVNALAKQGESPDVSAEAIRQRDAAGSLLSPRPRAVFMFHEPFPGATAIVSGQYAAEMRVEVPAVEPATNAEIPVIVTEETAIRRGLSIGDRLVLTPFWESTTPFLTARIEGIVRPKDPGDRYWSSAMATEASSLIGQNYVPMYVSETTFHEAVGRLLPEMLADYTWTVVVDPSKIDPANARLAAFGVDRLGRTLRAQLSVGFLQETSLDRALLTFSTKDVFGRVPLLIVIMMMVAVVLFYLVMVSNVVVERHLGEMALLRSRGADAPQILTVYLWEALFLSTAAFVLGPVLAWGATSLLGYTSVFAEVTAGGPLPARLTGEAVLAGWVASLVALSALLVPTARGIRLEVTQFKASAARPASDSFFTRYYLDVFAAIVAGVLFWELTQKGSVFTTTLLGQTSADQALLAAPALILLAVALVFLRVFPYAMKGLAWLASRARTVPIVLAFWHLGRNPMPYALPALLLMLASAIAMFAANFGATVSRSHEDRAAYEAGTGFRVVDRQASREERAITAASAEAARTGIPSSMVYRGQAAMALDLFNFSTFSVLAVDPGTFPAASWYRDDFSEMGLTEVLAPLEADTPSGLPGIPIPDQATGLGVWASSAGQRTGMLLAARVVDAGGRYTDISLGPVQGRDWRLMTGDFSGGLRPGTAPVQRPFRLVALYVLSTRASDVPAGVMYLDSIETIGPSPVTLVDVRDKSQSSVIQDNGQSAGDSLELNEALGRPGRGPAAAFIWAPGSPLVSRGLAFGSQRLEEPLNAVVSRSLLDSQGAAVGDVLTLGIAQHGTPVRITGVVDFFPTLDPYEDGFVVVNLPALLARVNSVSPLSQAEANELWLSPRTPAEAAALDHLLRQASPGQVVSRDGILSGLREDPLVAAGWTGVLRMAFLAVLITTLLGFSVYSMSQAQRRGAEFAMLRSLGTSGRAVTMIVLVEQALVVAIGMALGSWLGVRLTELIMPFLGLNEAGLRVLPPFRAAMDWQVIAVVYGLMLTAFTATTLILAGVFSRTAIQRALRFGEA